MKGIVLDRRIINLLLGLSGYIVFPSIDWTSKGARFKELIQTMNFSSCLH